MLPMPRYSILSFLGLSYLCSAFVVQPRQFPGNPELNDLLSSVDDLLKFTPSDFGLTGDPTDFALPPPTKLNPNFTTYTGPGVSDIVSSYSEFTRTRVVVPGEPMPTFSVETQTIPPPPEETETSTDDGSTTTRKATLVDEPSTTTTSTPSAAGNMVMPSLTKITVIVGTLVMCIGFTASLSL